MPHHSAVGIACCKIEKIFFHSSLTRSNYSEKSSGMLDKLINYVHDLDELRKTSIVGRVKKCDAVCVLQIVRFVLKY
jgi:hypothetical protein